MSSVSARGKTCSATLGALSTQEKQKLMIDFSDYVGNVSWAHGVMTASLVGG